MQAFFHLDNFRHIQLSFEIRETVCRAGHKQAPMTFAYCSNFYLLYEYTRAGGVKLHRKQCLLLTHIFEAESIEQHENNKSQIFLYNFLVG
jgi:hypothetical protein